MGLANPVDILFLPYLFSVKFSALYKNYFCSVSIFSRAVVFEKYMFFGKYFQHVELGMSTRTENQIYCRGYLSDKTMERFGRERNIMCLLAFDKERRMGLAVAAEGPTRTV